MRKIILSVGLVLAATGMATSAIAARAADSALTLEKIMANPDWIGHAVERPYWSTDSERIYYSLQRDGSDIRDLHVANPATDTTTQVAATDLANADGPSVQAPGGHYAAFARHGDIFVRNLTTKALTQVTRTPQREASPQWNVAGTAVQYRRGNQWFSYSLSGGASSTVAVLRTENNPHDQNPDGLERLQRHLFKTLRHIDAEKTANYAHEQSLEKADPTRSPEPFWLGKQNAVALTSLSPDGRWMIVATRPAHYNRGKAPVVNHYVTDSGYVEPEKARPYVGRNKPAPQTLWLFDLEHHTRHRLSVDNLPDIHKDPLAKLRKATQASLRKAGHDQEAEALKAPATRSVSILRAGPHPIIWSVDGSRVATELRSNDNKDRWLVTINLDTYQLEVQDHLHDPAWINWNFNEFGFVPHGHELWYLSEATGYAQLYVKQLGKRAKQLTSGKFEVSEITPSPDGKWFYLKANVQAPYQYDLYRVPASGGSLQRITQFDAIDGFSLAPNGARLAVLHSKAYELPQLAVINTDGSGERELTTTTKAAYRTLPWIQPKFVEIPSSHGVAPIYTKIYAAPDQDTGKPRPAVFFVHGAGYLQDVTDGWSYYFREQMFNNLLAREGYIVIDMDYRGSAGYGRDWRTAIYQHMGHPELEDLLDGKAWLVKHYNVDPKRVGIYGGSYGGFMTEMALLRAPGEFAAGAALRPPSDWTSYNDQYTSDILNDPQLDPLAYKISSPIEFAANLQDPLLICHGLIDNNVLASDSIRLYQRFIELHKTHFWLSLYPMERHAFEHPDSWYDEYRRVYDLFTQYVKNRYTTGLPVAKTANGA